MEDAYVFVQNDGFSRMKNTDFLNQLLKVQEGLDKELSGHITPSSFRCGQDNIEVFH